MVLGKILGTNRDYVRLVEEWRKLHNAELRGLHPSPHFIPGDQIKMRWVWHMARMGDRRWEDNIKMDLQEVRWGKGLDFLAHNRER
jgi:hypothetical protein